MSIFKKRKITLDVIKGITITSKTSLKMQVLILSKGDLKEAKELYDFLASDMPNLPETDPVPPTWIDNTKDTVNGLMGWFKDNQDTIAQGYDFIRGILEKRRGVTTEIPETPLPNINE